MNVFNETVYGLKGKEAEDAIGAIADNALDAARKVVGSAHLPKTADDKRKRDMVAKILCALHSYDAEVLEGTLVAPFQVRPSKSFDDIEIRMAEALSLADAVSEEPVVGARVPRARVAS